MGRDGEGRLDGVKKDGRREKQNGKRRGYAGPEKSEKRGKME